MRHLERFCNMNFLISYRDKISIAKHSSWWSSLIWGQLSSWNFLYKVEDIHPSLVFTTLSPGYRTWRLQLHLEKLDVSQVLESSIILPDLPIRFSIDLFMQLLYQFSIITKPKSLIIWHALEVLLLRLLVVYGNLKTEGTRQSRNQKVDLTAFEKIIWNTLLMFGCLRTIKK